MAAASAAEERPGFAAPFNRHSYRLKVGSAQHVADLDLIDPLDVVSDSPNYLAAQRTLQRNLPIGLVESKNLCRYRPGSGHSSLARLWCLRKCRRSEHRQNQERYLYSNSHCSSFGKPKIN